MTFPWIVFLFFSEMNEFVEQMREREWLAANWVATENKLK